MVGDGSNLWNEGLGAYLGCRIDVNNGIKAIGSRVKALMRFVDLLSTR